MDEHSKGHAGKKLIGSDLAAQYADRGFPIDAASCDAASYIDGVYVEANGRPTPVSASKPSNAVVPPDPLDGASRTVIPPQQDDVLLAQVTPAKLTVLPGAGASLSVRLLNNGPVAALFELWIEGWIDPAWLDTNPVYRQLGPGEQARVDLTLTPPRRSSSLAGERQIVFVVRAQGYPGRETRQTMSLTLLPFDDITLGDITPRRLSASRRARVAVFSLPVTNNGNRKAMLRVQGQGNGVTIDLQQADGQDASNQREPGRECLLHLEPGRTALLQGRLRPHRLPLLKLGTESYRVLANVVGKQQVPRAVSGQLAIQPLLNIRHLTLAAALLTFLLITFALLGMAGFGVMRLVEALPNTAPPTAQPVIPQIALVLPLDVPTAPPEPAAEMDSAQAAPMAGSPAVGASADPAVSAAAGREASVPLVQADQISAPGSALPAGAPLAAPAPVAAVPPADDRASLTYAQMFQEIALRYDLDWRLLAAQAYMESRFDTLALGKDGDLGLMQVLPNTWQAWAPVVDVNDPFDAYSNTLVAAVYLDHLRTLLGQQGYAEARWMLVAYNWGPEQLSAFLAEGNTWADLPQSLRDYASEILRIAESLSG